MAPCLDLVGPVIDPAPVPVLRHQLDVPYIADGMEPTSVPTLARTGQFLEPVQWVQSWNQVGPYLECGGGIGPELGPT